MSNAYKNLLAAGVLAVIAAGCRPGLPASSNTKGDSTSSPAMATATATATSAAAGTPGSDETVWINGAYLACDYVALVGADRRTVRMSCRVLGSDGTPPPGAWSWTVVDEHGAQVQLVTIAAAGNTATIEIPAPMLAKASVAAHAAALPTTPSLVVPVKQAVLNNLGSAAEPTTKTQAADQQDQLLSCLGGSDSLAQQCFSAAGYQDAQLVGEASTNNGNSDVAMVVGAAACVAGAREFYVGSAVFVLPAHCAMRVMLRGAGGSGGGAIIGNDGTASTFLDLSAGGGGGGWGCAQGGDGGLGGVVDFEFFVDESEWGWDGGYVDDIGLGVGGPGGSAPVPSTDVFVATGGEPGHDALSYGAGGGGATGTANCGGGGGSGAYIMHEYTQDMLADYHPLKADDGSYTFTLVVGAGGKSPAENANAGSGGDGVIRIEWYPEAE